MSAPHDGGSQVPPHPEGYADDAHRYRLDSRIATGGMGEVWLATDETLGRQVAVKLLKTELADDAGFRTRFETEARNAARLQHPGVAGVYDYGQASPRDGSATPRPFLVMEYVDGQPLSDLLRPGSPMPPAVAVPLLAQAADAIGAAHAAGIVHRDVKPANLLVTADRTMKITDFGIARAAEGVALTQTGQVMGTPQYLAPEQAEGRQAVPASDVYSLACVAYECLMGARPFTGESSVAVALAHLREPVPQLGPDVPRDLAAVVERGLAKQPSERFADGAAFARALRDPSSVSGAPAAAAPPPASDSTSVMPAVAAGAAGAGLGAAAGAAAAGSTRDTPAQRPAPTPTADRTTRTEERPPGERRRKGVPGWLPAAVLAAAALLAILVVAIVFTGDDDQRDDRPTDPETSDSSTPDEEQTDEAPDDDPPPSDTPPEETTPPAEPEEPTTEPEEPTPSETPEDTLEPTDPPVETTIPETGTDQGIDERENLAPAPRGQGAAPTTPGPGAGPETEEGEAP